MVAFTVVALGTSLPEFIVAIQALVAGYPGILLGNVVGSNVANTFLIVGVTAAVYPVVPGDEAVRRDTGAMVVVSALFAFLCVWTGLDRGAGVVLVLALGVVLYLAGRDALRAKRSAVDTPLDWVLGLPSAGWLIAVFLAAGVVGLPLGARLVVDAAVEIAAGLGVSETVVGLTIIAFSTSLPELATTLVAAYRKRTEVVLGTVVGSNVFNIVAIMGVSAALSPTPIPVPPRFAVLDLPLLVVGAGVLAAFVWARRRIGRLGGVVMAVTYAAYVTLLLVGG